MIQKMVQIIAPTRYHAFLYTDAIGIPRQYVRYYGTLNSIRGTSGEVLLLRGTIQSRDMAEAVEYAQTSPYITLKEVDICIS